MKFFFKKKLSRQFFERFVSLIIILSFFVNTMLPQIVEAQPSYFSAISNIFAKDSQESLVVVEDVNNFPNIGEAEPRRVVLAVMTAYSSEAAQTDSTPCIPADFSYNLCKHYEQDGEQNSIASNFLPMGTKVRFPDLYGDKVFVVRDRMNARYGNGRGDIWMPTKAEAKTFGVKRVKMEIFYR
ncbi:MAG: hypothetical protein COY69_00505 [Candidatus Magasanikbacteria bacterium CG_4_10_14_0_8_um_filter_32_14]|uniref:3D domain-containing protein n=2 Tax=Candidatus Magasanikiibacteriota TaxID=1752731 RepID=A0A2M7RBG7_9BACT|nr:MAG: hypothetical protein AUJ23_03430 [Candidatus Magasanikbacteria bacterium CG1_02_32_51]PIY93656.1 MAG: hypothetical protein COY69_00505 [Candidatus Magasanikbacteria bacterium CG_4_10_14_0_8_um_filter_32_14]